MDNECTLDKSCPRGYYRKDLEEIARKCGISEEDIESMNMNKLCTAISRREYFPDTEDLPYNITPRLCKSSKYSRQDIKSVVDRRGIDMSHIPGYHTRPMLCQALADDSLPGAPCRLTKVCPGNYKKSELVRVATSCGVGAFHDDGNKKNMGELCVDILDHIDDQAEIAEHYPSVEEDLITFEGDNDLIDFSQEESLQPGIIPPPPPLFRTPVDITPELIEQLIKFRDVFNIIAETGFICLNDKTWLTCTRNIDDYSAAKKAVALLKNTLDNYHPDLGESSAQLWNIQSKDGTLKDIMNSTVCTHVLGVKLMLLYLVWYVKLVQHGVDVYLPEYITQVGGYSMFFTGYISPDVMRPFSNPNENIFNIMYFQVDPVQTYGEAKLSISKDEIMGDVDVINRNVLKQITGTPNYWDKLNSEFQANFEQSEKDEAESRVMMNLIQPLVPALDLFTGVSPQSFENIEDLEEEDLDEDVPLSRFKRPPIKERIIEVEEEPGLGGLTQEDIISYYERLPRSPIAPAQPPSPQFFLGEEEEILPEVPEVSPVMSLKTDTHIPFSEGVGQPQKPEVYFQENVPPPGFDVGSNWIPPVFNFVQGDVPKPSFPVQAAPNFYMEPTPPPNIYDPTEEFSYVPAELGGQDTAPRLPNLIVTPEDDDDFSIEEEDSDDLEWLNEVEAAVDVAQDDKYTEINEEAGNAEAIQSIFAAFIAQEGTKEERQTWSEGHKFMDGKLRIELAASKIDCLEFQNIADYKNCVFNMVNDLYTDLFDTIDEDGKWSNSSVGKDQLRDLINRLDV